MSERAKFFNRRSGDVVGKYTYSAEDFAEFFNTFFSDGVVGTGLRVSTSNMGIVVNSGYAIISGHWYNNDSSLTLLNPSVVTTKRKDSIAIKLDKSERTITAVWVTGSTDSYPVLVDDSDIKYIKLADIELLAGGVIKAVYDKRPYCHALYTVSLDEFNERWDNFLKVCNTNYNQYVRKATANSELVKARGGYDLLTSRLSIIDYLLELLFESATDNLFDKERLLIGELDNKGSVDNSITNSFTTDYISINEGMTLYFWDRDGKAVMPDITEWYSNKSADGLIKYINYSDDTRVVNDCSAKYIRLSFNNTIVNADNLQITLSNKEPTNYTEFAYKIKEQLISITGSNSGTGLTEEQLKQIQSNTATIAKLEAETTADIKNIKTALNNGFDGKVISILGDSISTFAGYIPTADGYNLEHRARYPQDDLLTDVEKTWWQMLIKNLGAKLGVNDSWAGTTVSNTSTVNEADSGPDACMASLTRIKNLGSNGTPDVILFFGGTNDIYNSNIELGSFTEPVYTNKEAHEGNTWTSFARAFEVAIHRLQAQYPATKIVVLLPTYTTYYSEAELNEYNKVMIQICECFGIQYIDLRKCFNTTYKYDTLGDGLHPNELGMRLIEKQVRKELLANCELEVGENVVYKITNNLINTKSTLPHIYGISKNKSYSSVIFPVDGYYISSCTATMGGVDLSAKELTEDAYGNFSINISHVTGDIVITAIAISTQRISANEHIQEIPSDATAETNLYSVLEPQDSYYNSSGNWITETPIVPSIVIPVLPGDHLASNSFGEGSWDGIEKLGIRVTYLLDNEIVTSVPPATVYAEYTEKGYITVPEGVNTVCVPYWNKSDDNVLYLLTL